jgi:hypothetical protein
MKTLTIAAFVAAVCFSAAQAGVSATRFTYSPVTIVCSAPEVDVYMGTYAGGNFTANFWGKPLLNASPGFGISFDKRRCKRIRTRTLPRPVVPRPNFPMQVGEDGECSTNPDFRNVAVVLHVHFLKRAGRLSGLYASVRVRRTGRFIAAALITLRGSGRGFWGSTCVSR